MLWICHWICQVFIEKWLTSHSHQSFYETLRTNSPQKLNSSYKCPEFQLQGLLHNCNQTTGVFLVLLLDVGAVSVDKTRLQSNNWSFVGVGAVSKTRRGCNQTTGVFFLLMDVGTVSADKTRLQSNKWSFPHVLVGCWHGICRQFAGWRKNIRIQFHVKYRVSSKRS